MKTFLYWFIAAFAMQILLFINRTFARVWYKRFDPRHAWAKDKIANNSKSLRHYVFHNWLDIFFLPIGSCLFGRAAWIAFDLSEWLLFSIALTLAIGNFASIFLCASILNGCRRTKNYMRAGQEVELQLKN